jgi:hypothetical protein
MLLPRMPLFRLTEGDAALDAVMWAMPQLCAMSVAFEAHGEIVPKRGMTKNSSVTPSCCGLGRLAVGQHGAEAGGVVGRQRRAASMK